MRLFVAIQIPSEIRAGLAAFVSDLRALAPLAKWVRANNMHVTLKFLGETDSAKFGQVQAGLAAIRSAQAVTLKFRGLGFFPNEKRPRVLWAGIAHDEDDPLARLHAATTAVLAALGHEPEERAFTPHITLARARDPRGDPALAAVAAGPPEDHGPSTITSLLLYRSDPGARYSVVATLPFE